MTHLLRAKSCLVLVVLLCSAAICGCGRHSSHLRKRHYDAIDISAPITDKNIHTVRQGDTLSSIAREIYGDASRWELLFYANADLLDTPEDLLPGMRLYIPSADAKKTYEYVVKEGDTLSRIAVICYSDRSKAAVIAKYNKLKDPDYVVPGQKLIIPLLR